MSATHKQVKLDASIVEAKTNLIPPSQSVKENIIREMFDLCHWIIDTISYQGGSHFKVRCHLQDVSYKLNIFLSSIRDEDRQDDEFKMQLGQKNIPVSESGWTDIVLGVYIKDPGDTVPNMLFVGFNPTRYNFTTNPSLRGARTSYLRDARMYGFVKTENCCLFRPEFFAYYIKNLAYFNDIIPYLENAPAESLSGDSDDVSDGSSYGYNLLYYGAPGTGKSFSLNEDTKGEDVIRTTFHPDSDYTTFVGSYKPVEVSVLKTQTLCDFNSQKAIQVPVVDIDGTTQITEKRITYQFIQQAFLKAYIKAWKKHLLYSPTEGEQSLSKSFRESGADYQIVSVDDSSLVYDKIFLMGQKAIYRRWKQLWKEGEFKPQTGARPGQSAQDAVVDWIYNQLEEKTQAGFQDGWDELIKQCSKDGFVENKPANQLYKITVSEEDSSVLTIATEQKHKDKARINSCYSGQKKAVGVEKGIKRVLQSYDLPDFDSAWEKLKSEVVSSTPIILPGCEDVYLIIEEINRGDCAQIFGDVFQLLDRNSFGYSSYPIEADSDIQRELKKEFADMAVPIVVDTLFKDEDGGPIYYSYEDENGELITVSTAEAIKEGRILVIPDNLYIYATMNTSDQSLFPMDSAFKRRWEWRYFPIMDEGMYFKVVLDEKHQYDWWETIDALNKKIFRVSKSADKQLGYWFATPKDGTKFIDAKVFVSKVVFYLWNDVFKDYGFDSNNAFSQDIQFGDFFKSNGDINVDTVIKFMDKNQIKNEKEPDEATDTDTQNNNQPQ